MRAQAARSSRVKSSLALLLCVVLAAAGCGPAGLGEPASSLTTASISAEVASPSPSSEPAYPLSFHAAVFDMGTVPVGRAITREVSLSNDGLARVTNVSVAIEGPPTSGFAIDGACPDGVLGRETFCSFTLRFAPTVVGAAQPQTLRAVAMVHDWNSGANGRQIETTATLTGSGAARLSTSWVVRSAVPETTDIGPADLAATVAGDTEYIHTVTPVEELLDGADGAVYWRSGDGGRQWRQRFEMGGWSPQLAAAGRQVYIAYQDYGCVGIGVRRNSEHGRRRAWSGPTCLARTAQLAGSPEVAAADRFVYVASAGDARGRVAVHVSRDRGRTWSRVPLGSSRDESGEADGSVAVAATGRLAAVAWTDRNVSYVRISEDGGRRWSSPVRLSDGRVTSAAARDGRLAVSGLGDDGVPWVRLRAEDGTWRSITLPSTRDGPPEVPCYGESWVVLGPAGGVAVPYADCRWDGLVGGDDLRNRWVTTTDDGATWSTPDPLPGDVDESIPIVWARDGRAYMLFYGDQQYMLAVRDEGR